MAYVWSVVAVVVAVLAAAALAASLLGPLRRLRTVQLAAVTSIRDDAGILTARIAALTVRRAERRTDREGIAP